MTTLPATEPDLYAMVERMLQDEEYARAHDRQSAELMRGYTDALGQMPVPTSPTNSPLEKCHE